VDLLRVDRNITICEHLPGACTNGQVTAEPREDTP
jgi:hypothetical protein